MSISSPSDDESLPRVGGRGNRHNMTPDDRAALAERVLDMYAKGTSIRIIADCIGRGYGTVHRLLVAHDVELRGRGGDNSPAALQSPLGPGWRWVRVKLPDEEAPPGLPIITLDELDDLPDLEPLIEGVYNLGTVAVLSGQYGSGKSYTGFDQSACIAAGINWHGHKVTQGKVLYIAAEGSRAMKWRRRAWEKVNNTKIPAENFHVLTQPVQLHSEQADMLIEAVREGQYVLVVIDTQSRCTVGMDENAARDMGAIAETLADIANAAGGTVLDIHHDGKSASLRGSTAIPAAADTVLLMSEKDGIFTVRCDKQKDMADTPAMQFRLEVVDLDLKDKFGNPITNAAMVLVEPGHGPDVEHGVERITLISLWEQDLTYEEIAKAMKFKSKSTAYERIKKLLAEGVIQPRKKAA